MSFNIATFLARRVHLLVVCNCACEDLEMLKDKEINEIIITYMDDYSSTMLDMCRSVEKASISEIENFIDKVKGEISKALKNIESGNDYEGLLILKGIDLALRIRDENKTAKV